VKEVRQKIDHSLFDDTFEVMDVLTTACDRIEALQTVAFQAQNAALELSARITELERENVLCLTDCVRHVRRIEGEGWLRGLTLIANFAESPQIGEPSKGSHPDEQGPRDATWHQERQNWISQVRRASDLPWVNVIQKLVARCRELERENASLHHALGMITDTLAPEVKPNG